MKSYFEKLKERLNKGMDMVLVTVIASTGSTPRAAGARMLVGPAGRLTGTIGGGALEHRAEKLAGALLQEKKSVIQSFSLSSNQAADLGMVCGGETTVYFQYVPAIQGNQIGALLEDMETQQLPWLLTRIEENGNGKMEMIGEEEAAVLAGSPLPKRPFIKQEGEATLYLEPLAQPGVVYLFGGGHVAQALVPLLCRVGFRCVVYEDREVFGDRELFPQAEEIILGDFERIFDAITVTENDYMVVMTRGHQKDYQVERQALETKARYIGVIGSRSKVKAVEERLGQDGFGEADFNRVHSPIGLEIGAETPEEIAVSIAAQLIACRASQSEQYTKK